MYHGVILFLTNHFRFYFTWFFKSVFTKIFETEMLVLTPVPFPNVCFECPEMLSAIQSENTRISAATANWTHMELNTAVPGISK